MNYFRRTHRPETGALPADQDPRQEARWFRNSGSEKSQGRGRGRGKGRAPRASGAQNVPKPIADVSQNNAAEPIRGRVRQRAVSISSSASENELVPPPVPVIEASDSPVPAPPAAAAAPPVPVDAANPLQDDEPPAAVDIEPKVKNAGHREVIKTVLPFLRSVMLSADSCTKPQSHPAIRFADVYFLLNQMARNFGVSGTTTPAREQ